ncbi:NADP-dependent oxidoreductase domain-containing protein 1 [Genypterus blacodes]|uniref:NADP-dependent oxidoreductase domain-containing protein 1 n=1 Tax=Genypterus blacodes TaxID=154954 RepID=UPI003F763D12
MVDLTANLKSLSFESGLSDEEEKLLHLRERAAGRAVCGCAHATFLCKLLHTLRAAIKRRSSRDSVAMGQDGDLCVGILGLGHLGKQLLLSLREKTDIKPSHIKISTRRPESAVDFAQGGIECFFDNRRLAAWAHVLFLCCRPSHLPKVCADLRPRLPKHCLVYSFISAVPVNRLAQLLGHSFILRPQYGFVACDNANVWRPPSRVPVALSEPLWSEASCPLALSGGISLDQSWVCAVLYSLLNVCTSASVGSSDALSLINSLFQDKWQHTVELNTESYINSSCASSLPLHELFPWINLTDAQTKETPLSNFLSSSKTMQQCFSAAYKSLLETPVRAGRD